MARKSLVQPDNVFTVSGESAGAEPAAPLRLVKFPSSSSLTITPVQYVVPSNMLHAMMSPTDPPTLHVPIWAVLLLRACMATLQAAL